MLAGAAAHLSELATARIGSLLMCADEQDVRVIIEDVVSAVAVMHVIVKDHNLHAVLRSRKHTPRHTRSRRLTTGTCTCKPCPVVTF